MRFFVNTLLIGIGYLAAPPARAGLYNPAEPVPVPAAAGKTGKPLPFQEFRDRLAELLQLGNDQLSTPLRKHYLERRQALEGKRRFGRLTVEEQVELSAYLIRLRQYDAAIDLLTPLAAQERDNYPVLANLITAHFQAGQLDQAMRYLPQMESSRLPETVKLTPEQRAWFARVEPYFGKLVKLRFRASRAAANRNRDPVLDDLFGGNVRFVGESGEYEAGHLAAVERSKLPADALAVVQQLLLWLPDDTRLYWLFGELLNANGDVAGAAAVFAECRDSRRFDAPDLQKHRQVVQEALAQLPPPPGLDAGLPTTPEATQSWLAGKGRLLVVGAGVGLVVLALLFLQVREWLRRGNP